MKSAIAKIIVCWCAIAFSLHGCGGDCDCAPGAGGAQRSVSPVGTRAPPPVEDAEVTKAKQLIEEAYVLKRTGQNGAAMALFDTAHDILRQKKGENSFEIASVLDDKASVHVRLGEYGLAIEGYTRAKNIMEKLRSEAPLADRLLSGIEFRLSIVDALKARGILCAEPAQPATVPDGGVLDSGAENTEALPYFPDVEEMQREIGKLNSAIKGCAKGKPTPVLVKVVVTGQGQVVLAKPASADQDPEGAECVEQRIMEAARTADLPKFRACFRLFNYLFKMEK